MATSKKQLTRESGSSGTEINSGVITGEEYNTKLQHENALKIYNEMVSGDATVSAALDTIKQPIMAADFTVDPASDDEADQEPAELVRDCLFHIIDWNKTLDEILTFLENGFSLFEMVFEYREVNGNMRWALAKLGYRKQTTITKWEVEGGGEGVTQQVAGKNLPIPAEKLVRFTRKQRGDNYEGISILRPAYKHWYIKDKLYKIDAVGAERQALGVIEITTPKGAQPKDVNKLKKAARNLRANEQSYIIHPEGYTVGFMDMKSKSLKDIEPSINHHDRQIMKNVLAQFLEIGAAGSTGTRSTSEDHSRLFEKAVENVAKYVAYVLQNTVVRTLIDLNYTNRDYPTLRVGNTSDENVTLISQAVEKFVAAGVLHPTGSDENTTRKMIGWAELDKDELKNIDYRAKPGPEKPDNVEATVTELKSLRASVEKALYDQPRAAA